MITGSPEERCQYAQDMIALFSAKAEKEKNEDIKIYLDLRRQTIPEAIATFQFNDPIF